MGWGDEMIVTGQARVMQQTDRRKVRVTYEKPNRWCPAYEHNPRLAVPAEQGEFQTLMPRINGLRPYCADKRPDRWTWRAYQPPRGELYFTEAERSFGAQHAGRVIVEPHIKPGASLNKQWGWIRWNKLAWLLSRRGIRVTQMGGPETPLLEGADFIETPNMRLAAAVLSTARAAVLPEGGLHHTAAVFDTPSVVIYGGFISPEVTGYAGQTGLYAASDEFPLGCGWRVPCEHCERAMASIAPETVADELEKLLATSNQGMVGAVAAGTRGSPHQMDAAA